MEEKSKKPKIRFKGFTEDWEQRKLSEYGDFTYGHSAPKWSVTPDAKTPCVRYGELYTKFGVKIDKVFSYTNMPKNKLVFSKGNEVLIPRVGEDPYDYNHCTWLSMPNVAIGEMISIYYTKQNPLFTAIMYNATLRNDFAIRVEGGSVTNLYYDKLKDINVAFPNKQEQEKIATLFYKIDNLITLHQRKYDKLVNVKKSLLEKMFPQNNSNVPEIRFNGFTDAWEQRKFESIYSNIRNAFVGTATPYYVSEGHFYLESNNVKDGQINRNTEIFINERFYQKQKDKWLHTGDIVMVQSGHVGHTAVIPEKLNNLAAHALIMFSNQIEKHNPYFINYQAQNTNFKKKISNITTGNTIKHILSSDMKDFVIDITTIEEENKISRLLLNIDNLITLHQRKLEKLKNVKKSLLEKMFV